MHSPVQGHIYPRITGNRDHGHTVVIGIDMHNHHNLCKQSRKAIFIIVVTAKEQNIPWSSRNRAIVWRWFVVAATNRMEKFHQRSLDSAFEVRIAIGKSAAYQQSEKQEDINERAHPS